MAEVKAGSPTGAGNPPGLHSSSYLTPGEGSGESHFNDKSGYRGTANVGINTRATDVGNQPESERTADIASRSKGPALP